MVEVKCKRNQKKKILYNLNKNVKLQDKKDGFIVRVVQTFMKYIYNK